MKTVKVTKGNDFCLYVPLVVLNASGATPIQTSDLSNISVSYKTGCGTAASIVPTYIENYMVLTFPDTLAVGVYSLDITGKYSNRDIRKHINECFAVVEWDSQSNWRDFLVGDHVVTDTQAFIGVLYTNAEYQAKIAELNTKIAQAAAAKAEYDTKVAMLNGVAQQTTLTAVKSETDKIGDNTDASSVNTLFGWISSVKDSLLGLFNKIGTASAGRPQTLFSAIEGITIDTSSLAQRTDVKDGNDTAISVAKAVNQKFDTILNQGLITLDESIFYEPIVSATWLRFNFDRIIKELKYNTAVSIGFLIDFQNCIRVEMPNVTSVYGFRGGNLLYIDLHNCLSSSNVILQPNGAGNVRYLDVTNMIEYRSGGDPNAWGSRGDNLIELHIGANFTSSRDLYGWRAGNCLLTNSTSLLTAEDIQAGYTNNRQKFLYNLRTHIAGLLPQLSTEGYSIRFYDAVKSAILNDAETYNSFVNKGWTII